MQPRSEFPDLYTVDDKLHFNNKVANLAYDSMISKAREEALEKFGPNYFVLIVCAGWNAEGNQITSMKEAFCAKQLSLCRTTIDLPRIPKQCRSILMPKRLNITKESLDDNLSARAGSYCPCPECKAKTMCQLRWKVDQVVLTCFQRYVDNHQENPGSHRSAQKKSS